ncbi:MAG: hypothetical protein AAF598_00820 [Bacteroidota bacterium]
MKRFTRHLLLFACTICMFLLANTMQAQVSIQVVKQGTVNPTDAQLKANYALGKEAVSLKEASVKVKAPTPSLANKQEATFKKAETPKPQGTTTYLGKEMTLDEAKALREKLRKGQNPNNKRLSSKPITLF